MTSPDPVPAPAAPLAEIVTTEGSTSSATAVTSQPAAEPAATAPVVTVLDVAVDVHPALTTAPPTTTAGIRIQGHGRRRVLLACLADGVTGSRPSLMTGSPPPFLDDHLLQARLCPRAYGPAAMASAFTWRPRRASPWAGESTPAPTAFPRSRHAPWRRPPGRRPPGRPAGGWPVPLPASPRAAPRS